MGRITITDGVTSFVGNADERATPIWNANTTVTIGGVARGQADTQRLKIDLEVVGTQAEITALMEILKNFERTITYTPSRKLFDKPDTTPIVIAIVSSPKAEPRARDGDDLLFSLFIEAEEVVSD